MLGNKFDDMRQTNLYIDTGGRRLCMSLDGLNEHSHDEASQRQRFTSGLMVREFVLT